MAFAYKPTITSPTAPYGIVVRGSSNTFYFNDHGETHSAVNIEVANNDPISPQYWSNNGSSGLLQSGQVTSMWTTSATYVTWGSTAWNSLTRTDGYRWRVRLYSTANGYSAWSDWAYFNTASSASYISITSPSGGATGTRQPVIVWMNTNSTRVISARYVLTRNGITLYDAVIPCSVSQNVSFTHYIPVDHIDGSTYTISVTPTLSTGVIGNSASTNYKVSLLKFPEPTLTITDLGDGTVRLDCSQPGGYPTVTSQDVYRWSPQRNKFILLASGLDPSFSYTDKTAPLNTPFWYRVVSSASGEKDVWFTRSISIAEDDWVITDGTTRVVAVVTSFTADREVATEQYEPMGRSSRVLAVIPSTSRTGSIGIDLNPDERVSVLEAIRSMMESKVTILSPFGDSLVVRLTEVSANEVGAGRAEASISYIEEDES